MPVPPRPVAPERRGSGEIVFTLLALAVTAVAAAFFVDHLGGVLVGAAMGPRAGFLSTAAFALAAALLIYGNFVYLVTRHGALRRAAQHRPDSAAAIARCFAGDAPSLAVLVPSYKENVGVVRRTLLSAALQDYPHKQVVLLLDDPPQPADADGAAQLAAMRALPGELQALMDGIAREFAREEREWQQRRPTADYAGELGRLASLHRRAAAWLERRAGEHVGGNHEERFFVDTILLRPAEEHRARAAQLRRLALQPAVDLALVDGEYRRLAGLFRAEFAVFERKRFINLSHEPNKAMNLNSYLGVMGGRFAEKRGVGGRYLVPAGPDHAGRFFPDAEFVITLDADSVILRDYAARLVDLMRRPGNERMAVAQTPYSAYPGARSALERVAGATTDIQYFVHQGFTAHNATYWVGANALLRKAALEDIATTATERGHKVRRFIHDRTVIEDTESSVDLLLRGWSLYNYPERLAYSATPPDFGSLIIQRRRWANGGLLILPKLLRYLVQRRGVAQRLAHAFVGIHYLVSPAAVTTAVLTLLFVPVEAVVASPWLPLAALPYFIAYGRDLMRAGYRCGDLVGVYALNMLLVPVNFAGVARSLIQALTGRKSPFGRTPKVDDHTATPPAFLAAITGLFLACVAMAMADVLGERPLHGLFAGLNAALLGFGFLRYIGLHQALADLAQLGRAPQQPALPADARPVSPTDVEPVSVPMERQ